VSGARFNIDKTEIIPIGTKPHRRTIADTRKINAQDNNPLPQKIRITHDGEVVCILGVWIGNEANNQAPWEPILNIIKTKLNRWERAHLMLNGKCIILQAIVRGHTQFLAKAQGMPKHIEDALMNIMTTFIWEETKPRIAMATLQCPTQEGGLNILNVKSRNKAIKIIWLKAYLNFSLFHQKWATVTDHIILATAPPHSVEKARDNPFMQTWTALLRGHRAKVLNNNIRQMLKTARRYNVNLAAIKMTPHLLAQLPVWYHLAAKQKFLNNARVKCLMGKHDVAKVADLVRTSACLCHPTQFQTHQKNKNCTCQECTADRTLGCTNPHKCAMEALTRLSLIHPKYDLMKQEPPDSMSLTRTWKLLNERAKMG